MFNLDKYHQNLTTQWLGQSVNYFDELHSTNSYLKNLPAVDITHGQLCITDHQTKGRGQYERNWESEAGQNLTFTLAFRPSQTGRFHILTLACARAIVEQIEEDMGCEAFIKWPNDVLINNKKVTGLLTETVFNGNELDRVLVGIGLNVNQEKFQKEINKTACSLKLACDRKIDREEFLGKLLSRIEFEYMRWHKQNDELLKWINKKIIGYGKWIGLKVNGQNHSDKFKLLGINQDGQLAVIDGEGGIKTFSYEQIRLITD